MKLSETYTVPCIADRIRGIDTPLTVRVPGSKSITNRALLLATLAKGKSTLRGALFSDDSRHFLKCVQELGFTAHADEEKQTVSVAGMGGPVPKKEASLYVGSAGTAARFLTEMSALPVRPAMRIQMSSSSPRPCSGFAMAFQRSPAFFMASWSRGFIF